MRDPSSVLASVQPERTKHNYTIEGDVPLRIFTLIYICADLMGHELLALKAWEPIQLCLH